MFGKLNKVLLGVMLLGGVMSGSCLGCEDQSSASSPSIEPLTDTSVISRYVELAKSGEIVDLSFMKSCIDKTVDYYTTLDEKPSDINVKLEDWRLAKLAESLYVTSQRFSDLDVSLYCLEKIKENCAKNEYQNKGSFRLAELLLISQCREYERTNEKFTCKLLNKPNTILVGSAINKLFSATNGDIELSKKLIEQLSNVPEFRLYIPRKVTSQ